MSTGLHARTWGLLVLRYMGALLLRGALIRPVSSRYPHDVYINEVLCRHFLLEVKLTAYVVREKNCSI